MKVHTKMRIPTPVRICFASEASYQKNTKVRSKSKTCPETYKANTLFERKREGEEEIHDRIEAVYQPFVTASRLIIHLNLLLKNEENRLGGVACPELCSEWMGEKILLCTLFICFQGTNYYKLEMGRRDDTGVDVRHIEGEEHVQELQEEE